MNPYQQPMEPWPALAPYARRIRLARSGLALYLYDAGAAASLPMLLVHGLGDEADTWRHLIPRLMARHRVIAPDLPGFGRSDQPARPYTLPFFQEVLLELLDALGIGRAALVGHSLGAAIVQSMALDHPERAERLALLSGSLVARAQKVDLGTLLFLVPGVGEYLYNRLRRDPQAAYRTLEPYYSHLDRLPEADREFLFRRVNERVWSDGQRRAFFSALRHLAGQASRGQRPLAERLAGLQVPTLVLWGQDDRIASIENGRAVAELQPQARLVVVPGAGHDLHQEQPEAVAAAIEEGFAGTLLAPQTS